MLINTVDTYAFLLVILNFTSRKIFRLTMNTRCVSPKYISMLYFRFLRKIINSLRLKDRTRITDALFAALNFIFENTFAST